MYIYHTFSNFLVQKYKLVSKYPRKKRFFLLYSKFHDKENMISYRNHITGQNKKCSPVGITPSGEHFVYQFFDRAL